jgi:hypothetical protein
MLRFAFYQFLLGGRFHAPLPKMAPLQVAAMRRRLESIGFKVVGSGTLNATKGTTKIVVDPKGVCSSNEDLSDAITPALPEVLALEAEAVPFRVLRSAYFTTERRGSTSILRFSPRLEYESYWEELRSLGSCALTPDEKLVYSGVLSLGALLTPLVTDFPIEGSAVRRIGRRQYYSTMLAPRMAASSLRMIGPRAERNTYLPRDSIVTFGQALPPEKKLRGLFHELGRWCFLAPS